MNGLIIGGLFAVALLAMIGVAFFARGESAQAQTSAQDQASTAAAPETSENSDIAHDEAEASTEAALTVPTALAQDITGPLAIGQVHELAAELRTLHQQALELGQRLNVLTEIADHIERVQESYVSVTEDQ